MKKIIMFFIILNFTVNIYAINYKFVIFSKDRIEKCFKGFKEMSWATKHEYAIMKVLIREVDTGTVRTGSIERMDDGGLISMDYLKILNKKDYPNFPFVASTELYPELPIAKLTTTDTNLTDKVFNTLKIMKPNDKAAKKAKILGWSDPEDYKVTEDPQRTLKIESFKQ